MSIWELAILQAQREGRGDASLSLVIDRAIDIRHYFDLQDRGRAIAKARGKYRCFI